MYHWSKLTVQELYTTVPNSIRYGVETFCQLTRARDSPRLWQVTQRCIDCCEERQCSPRAPRPRTTVVPTMVSPPAPLRCLPCLTNYYRSASCHGRRTRACSPQRTTPGLQLDTTARVATAQMQRIVVQCDCLLPQHCHHWR